MCDVSPYVQPRDDARKPSELSERAGEGGKHRRDTKDAAARRSGSDGSDGRRAFEYSELGGQKVTLEVTEDGDYVRMYFWWHPRDAYDPDDELEILVPKNVLVAIAHSVEGDAP